MSNKAQRVGSRGPYSTRRSRVLYSASIPHTECLLLIQHILSILIVFSSVKHKNVLHDKDSSAV